MFYATSEHDKVLLALEDKRAKLDKKNPNMIRSFNQHFQSSLIDKENIAPVADGDGQNLQIVLTGKGMGKARTQITKSHHAEHALIPFEGKRQSRHDLEVARKTATDNNVVAREKLCQDILVQKTKIHDMLPRGKTNNMGDHRFSADIVQKVADVMGGDFSVLEGCEQLLPLCIQPDSPPSKIPRDRWEDLQKAANTLHTKQALPAPWLAAKLCKLMHLDSGPSIYEK